MIIHNDFKDFLALLNKYNVRYLIMGGYAVSAHATPRNTDDIDIWIDSQKDNAKKYYKFWKILALEELVLQ